MGCAKWHHHHLAKRERLWDWDRSNALCTLYILLVILVYLSDVFISLDWFFTECSISLWIKEVWIILFTFFSFIVFQTMNFASYALSHLLCTLLVLNLAIFATQNFAGIYFCNLNKKNMKKGIKFHDFHINFYITWNKQNGNLVPIRQLDFDFSSLDSDLFVYYIILEWYCIGFLNDETERVFVWRNLDPYMSVFPSTVFIRISAQPRISTHLE